MGIQNLTATYTIPDIQPDQITFLTPDDSLNILKGFCDDHGITRAALNGAIDIFRRASAQPGKPVIVATHINNGGRPAMAATRAIHNAMEALTNEPIITGVTGRAFDLSPADRFVHSMRHDACQVVVETTNLSA